MLKEFHIQVSVIARSDHELSMRKMSDVNGQELALQKKEEQVVALFL